MGGRPSPGSGAQRRRMQRGQDIHHVKSLKENKGREHVGRRSTLCDRLPVDHGRVHKNIYKRVFLFVVFSCNVNENLEVMYRMEISLVLVPVDFSDCSVNAIRYARKIVSSWKAELLLIHVVNSSEVSRIANYTKETIENVKERLTNQAKQGFRHLLNNWNSDVLIKDTIVSYGSPFQEIAIKARELQVDLILMGGYGSKGKGQIDEIFFGGTVEKVVRLLPCPVLCVPMGWPTENI